MATQREIAQTLGITQAAVSMALRGDRSISPEMRKQVLEAAQKAGYSINKHVSALMSNVRTGKKLTDKGVVGILIDALQKPWLQLEFFRQFHSGVVQRAQDLGFRVESFFLKESNLRDARIDQILYARGVDGIILAPPGHAKNPPNLQWDRYAVVDAAVGWEDKEFNRVCCDQFQNYTTVFHELLRLGYKRIGTALDSAFVQGTRQKTQWHTGYLACQHDLPEGNRIPVFACNKPPPGNLFSQKTDRKLLSEFSAWFQQWTPDAIITLDGDEKRWVEAMTLNVPGDVGIACLAQLADDSFAGIDEKTEFLGAAALEQVAAQIARNEFGHPSYPRVTMIAGQWRNGITVSPRQHSNRMN